MAVAVGASNLFFSRDTKVYIKQGTNIWEIPVQSGYSFSQSTNADTITLNEMSDATGRSRRGQKVFNTSLSPAEWSFESYARPVLISSQMRSSDEILWASLVSNNAYIPALATTGIATTTATATGGTATLTTSTAHGLKVGDTVVVAGVTPVGYNTTGSVVTAVPSSTQFSYVSAGTGAQTVAGTVKNDSYNSTSTFLDYKFSGSNTTTLGTFDMYFVLGGNQLSSVNYTATGDTTIYKLAECVVNEVTMNFEIDGIATFSWSGNGKTIDEVDTFDATGVIKDTVYNGSNLITNNLIRNRLTAITATSTTPTATTYTLAITGGSITISNNISFLTPETLGIVNQPLGHVTGTRSVTGTFTSYLDEATGGSKDLYKNLVRGTSTVTNSFALGLYVGGKASTGMPTGPGILFDLGQCHLEVPSINNDDVIAVEVNFTALPSNISGTDEINKVRLVGIAP